MFIYPDLSYKKIVRANPIETSEAKQVKNKLFDELKEIIDDILNDLDIVMKDIENEDNINPQEKLDDIKNSIINLQEEVKKDNIYEVNLNDLEVHIDTVVEIFRNINIDKRLKNSIIILETKAVIARFKIKRIIDADSIIKDPEKGTLSKHRSYMTTIDKPSICNEIRELLPKFLGYRIKVKKRGHGIEVRLVGKPLHESYISPTETLKSILFDYFEWELRKFGLEIKCELNTCDDRDLKWVFCRIDLSDKYFD
jgi:hypothetical protein